MLTIFKILSFNSFIVKYVIFRFQHFRLIIFFFVFIIRISLLVIAFNFHELTLPPYIILICALLSFQVLLYVVSSFISFIFLYFQFIIVLLSAITPLFVSPFKFIKVSFFQIQVSLQLSVSNLPFS